MLKSGNATDHSFLNDARNFLITQALHQGRDIDFRALLDIVGKDALAEFVDSVIDKVIVTDKRVTSITFKMALRMNSPISRMKKANPTTRSVVATSNTSILF